MKKRLVCLVLSLLMVLSLLPGIAAADTEPEDAADLTADTVETGSEEDPTGDEPADAPDEDPDESAETLIDGLPENGDRVVICNAQYEMALNADNTGAYVAWADGAVQNAEECLIWDVTANEDGTYRFSQNDRFLSMGAEDFYTSYDAENQDWTIETHGEGYSIKNVAREVYLRWNADGEYFDTAADIDDTGAFDFLFCQPEDAAPVEDYSVETEDEGYDLDCDDCTDETHHDEDEVDESINDLEDTSDYLYKANDPFIIATTGNTTPQQIHEECCYPTWFWPTVSKKVNSTCGNRPSYGRWHNGIDIYAKVGTNVYSTETGSVKKTGYESSMGNYIFIYHEQFDVLSVYMHLSEIKVSKGDNVSRGQLIALSGNTGNVDAHLHFELVKGNTRKTGEDYCINTTPKFIDGVEQLESSFGSEVYWKKGWVQKYTTTCKNHDANYTQYGKCNNCESWLPNKDDNYPYTSGIYAVKSGKTAYLREGHPYQIATPYETLSAGNTVTVDGCVLNGFGNQWYHCVYNNKEYWCVAGNLELQTNATSDLKITMPATNHTNRSGIPEGDLEQGKTWNLSGTISSTYYNITEVACHIYNSSGNDAITAYTAAPNAKTYDIKSGGMDSKMTFGKLSVGSYTFVVSAKDASGKTAELRSNFRIVSSAPTTCTVTFDPNGGSVSETSRTVTVGSTYGDLPTATRTGYTFNGWFTQASGGSQVTASTQVTNSSNHTLYAHWQRNALTINYNSNGGVVNSDRFMAASDGIIQENGSNINEVWYYDGADPYGLYNASTFGLSRQGYAFVGWSRSRDGSTTIFGEDDLTLKAQDICPDLANGNASVVLYAVWSPYALTINYNTNGGVVNSDRFMAASDGTIQENGSDINEVWHYNSADPYGLYNASTFGLSRQGYAFAGWSRSRDGSTTIFGEDDLTLKAQDICSDLANGNASVVLYAVWNLSETYALDLNGYLDGEEVFNISGYGTADIYVNGTLVADDCSDFCTYYPYGTTYEITDIKPLEGKEYVDVYSGSLSGTLTKRMDVYLHFETKQHYLEINGRIDGVWTEDISDFGSFDLYINGEKWQEDRTTSWKWSLPYGATWEIKDIKVNDGKSFAGFSQGSRTGTVTQYNYLELAFTTVQPEEWLRDKSYEKQTYNGHTYLFFDDTATWYEAKIICEYLGGHLATVTDQAENDFACNLADDKTCWLGGTNYGNEGTFRWITDEPMEYTNWSSGQPSNTPWNDTEGTEDYLQLYGDTHGAWNDCSGCRYRAFMCEIDSITVEVSFDPNGGSVSPDSIIVNYGETYGSLPEPMREGYNFDGWFTAISGGTRVTESTTVTATSDHTLYAHWNPSNTYTVTFNPEGGSVSPSSKTVYYDSNYGTLPTPTREGYTFNGWYTKTSSGTLVTSTTKVTIARDHTLYAHWTANTYTVTFNTSVSSASVTPTSKAVTFGSTYGELPTPTRTGYTFDGWYTKSSSGTKVTSATKVKTAKDHSLYAHWTANTYTVTFNTSVSSASVTPTTKTVTFGSTYGELPTPTRTGYTFDGWYTKSSSGTLVTSTTKVKTAKDHTLYAHWTANTYTVTFNTSVSSASVTTSSKTVTFGSAYGELPTPILEGYTFDGWYTKSSSGTKVTSATKVTIAKDHSLYAHWTANTYTVTFNTSVSSASVTPTSKTVTYGSEYGELPTPTREGYTFDGWYTKSSSGTLVTSTTKVKTAKDHTLYAHWTANTYTVTFNTSVSSASVTPTSKTVTYGSAYGELPTPTRAGYTFDGWYTKSSSGTLVTSTTKVKTAKDHSLYAHWTANTYMVTFNTVSSGLLSWWRQGNGSLDNSK